MRPSPRMGFLQILGPALFPPDGIDRVPESEPEPEPEPESRVGGEALGRVRVYLLSDRRNTTRPPLITTDEHHCPSLPSGADDRYRSAVRTRRYGCWPVVALTPRSKRRVQPGPALSVGLTMGRPSIWTSPAVARTRASVRLRSLAPRHRPYVCSNLFQCAVLAFAGLHPDQPTRSLLTSTPLRACI